MTVQKLQVEFLQSSEARLAPEDFFVLLAHVTDKDKTFLLAHPEYALNAETETKARECFARRLKHEPVAYITGHKEFYGRDFLVTPDTLIPRPETELLVELILNKIESRISNLESRKGSLTVLDIGTGSGNIIVSVASECKSAPRFKIQDSRFSFHTVDTSRAALAVAKENAKCHEADTLISFQEGSLLEPLVDELTEADEIIIAANLPYLSEEIYQSSADDVKVFEPRSALVSDQAGLDHYYRLLEQTKAIGKPSTLFLEISPEQSPIITDYLATNFPQAETPIHQDLSSRDRIVEIKLA